MLIELSAKEWEQEISLLKDRDLFDELTFIDCISRIYTCNVKYYAINNRQQTCVLLQVYTDANNRIILPTHFFYTAWHTLRILEEDDTCIEEALNELIKKHKKIQLKLPPRMQTTFVFINTGFVVKPYKTMIKTITDEKYSENIQRLIKRSQKENIELKINTDIVASYALNAEMMQQYGTSKAEINRFELVLNELIEKKKAYCFAAYQNKKLIGASFLINDFSRAYLMTVNSLSEYSKKGVQARIYDEFFKFFRKMDLNTCDLMGANIPTIAAFKAKFYPNRAVYYSVEYDRFYAFNQFVIRIKQQIKKYL